MTNINDSALEKMRIAVCGELPTSCKMLRDMGISRIDRYNDALELALDLRSGTEYHLILVYAPQGEGLDTDFPYKQHLKGEWKSVPVRLLNEPACHSALVELKLAVNTIAKESFG